MRKTALWLVALLLAGVTAVPFATQAPVAIAGTDRPELAYLEAVNRAGPPKDIQLLFLLMGEYASANRHREGAEKISALLKEFAPRLNPVQQSLYLAAIGGLRAGAANSVPFYQRLGWVNDTIGILEEARQKSGGQVFVVRWITGVAYSQLPGLFGKRQAAKDDLNWCLDHLDKAPHVAWAREAYFHLARLAKDDGDAPRAQKLLALSGYPSFDKPVTLTAPNSLERATGHAFAPRRITEVVPGRVYALSGFEFTEYYFVVSDDGRELIGIDAGTRDDSAKEAYAALRARVPGLPPLTTVFITHSHWDHIGGQRYYRSLTPRPKFYANANYRAELTRSAGAPHKFGTLFFGERYDPQAVAGFKPDATIERETEVRVGGTRFRLIPIAGGETDDGLFIHVPALGTLFVGDFIMPYLGAPFAEEGSLPGLLDAIDLVVRLDPAHILHGHEPLTRVFPSVAVLKAMRPHLAWLNAEVLAAVQRGEDRATIQQANLVPPGLLAGEPMAHLPYLVMRENVINRVFHQTVGYWQSDLQGMDMLGAADRGAMLTDYLGLSERQIAQGAQRMIADGKYELAASTLGWARTRYASDAQLRELERLAYLKLAEKYQNFNPFKLIIYAGQAGFELPQMPGSP